MNIIEKPSPHFRATRKAEVDTLVIHYISAVNVDKNDPFNVDTCLGFLTEPIPIGNGKSVKVSAHYLIDRAGKTYRLVKDENVAWHAGKSELHGRSIRNSCNDFSIGVELVGGAWINFTEAQYTTLIELTKDIQTRYTVPKENIVGHEDIAPGRKTDPGKKFNWTKYLDGVFKAPEEITDPQPVEPVEEEKAIYPAEEMTNNITGGKEGHPFVTFITNLILRIFNIR